MHNLPSMLAGGCRACLLAAAAHACWRLPSMLAGGCRACLMAAAAHACWRLPCMLAGGCRACLLVAAAAVHACWRLPRMLAGGCRACLLAAATKTEISVSEVGLFHQKGDFFSCQKMDFRGNHFWFSKICSPFKTYFTRVKGVFSPYIFSS